MARSAGVVRNGDSTSQIGALYYLDEHWRAILGLIRQLNPWVAAVTLAGMALLFAWGWYRWRRQQRAES